MAGSAQLNGYYMDGSRGRSAFPCFPSLKPNPISKAEVSTWLRIGTFYLALTGKLQRPASLSKPGGPRAGIWPREGPGASPHALGLGRSCRAMRERKGIGTVNHPLRKHRSISRGMTTGDSPMVQPVRPFFANILVR